MEIREYHDEYSESAETDFRKLEGALLRDTVKLLAPNDPVCLREDATAHDAITKMTELRRSAVVIVDDERRMIGIFTERDVLTRIAAAGLDARQVRLGEVMTREPEALEPDDLVCFAINRMHLAGFRSVPLVDAERRPIGLVTRSDVVQWLAELFPETVVNLRPGGRIKRLQDTDAG